MDTLPLLDRATRNEISRELWRTAQMMASKLVITYSEDVIQIVMFPPTGESYHVPGGPKTNVIKDGVVDEYS